MEVPAVEDSMEMASPYQANHDDFDIDLDLMEDQVSNMDSDMMGADDYPTSQPSLFNNDAINDADMVDEPSEGSMVDADDIVDEDDDVEVQDEEVTYEAEMQEGDQPVAVDAPVLPTIQVDVSANIENQTNPPIQNALETVPQQVTQEGFGGQPEMTPVENKPQEPILQASQPAASEEAQSEKPQQQSAEVDADGKVESLEETNEATESKASAAKEPLAQVEPPTETLESLPVQASSAEADNESVGNSKTHTLLGTEHHGAHDHDDESLHPVKVLYQGNEISLFPPLEGDSAETFFLHDEDVAYENVGRLFSSLREILLDNVAEHEVLVIDIDSLGIQIAEDSSHASNMTLHQILDVYLRLCHNDGTDEPDALYLSLTSKPTCHSELAALVAAADEGKGLSQIHEWYGYDEVEEASHAEDKPANVEETDDPRDFTNADESEQETAPELDEATQDTGPFADSHHEVHEASGPDVKHAEMSHEPAAGDREAEGEADDHEITQGGKEDVFAEPAPGGEDHNDTEGHYDSEAQQTDSSATVASVSHRSDQVDIGATATVVSNDLGQHDDESADAQGSEHEDVSPSAEAYDVENPEKFQDTHAGEHAIEGTGDHANEEPHGLDVVPEDEESPAGDIDDGSYEQSESTLEPAQREDSANHEQKPEPEDDLLARSPEDDLATPPPPVDDGAEDDDADNQQSGNGDDDDDGDGDGDDDFDDYYPPPDLEVTEVTEAIELGEEDPSLTDSHTLDNVSTKRSREEEDEWDIAEATTPNLSVAARKQHLFVSLSIFINWTTS
ncbi:uncharacterized protein N7477_002338 [Penicillium maclennaniae]|uniref:uncharacterized protein n=1 Tax=Penicillium maclennaniae TaxID=1343394 RepID=UPI00254211A4|nr:uncharacterized protein N7477_002338 [Penicillium maclennaniae]KAJ5676705.1 hypothetical protein N7477_002338 [Penicillium maclennaniae]